MASHVAVAAGFLMSAVFKPFALFIECLLALWHKVTPGKFHGYTPLVALISS